MAIFDICAKIWPNLVPMAKNVHLHHPSLGLKLKMFATPPNLDSMILTEEKCHIFIIYLEKYGNVSFRVPNWPKISYEGIFGCILLPLRHYFTLILAQKLTFGRYSLVLLRYQSFGHQIWPYWGQNRAKFGPK